MGRWDEAAKEAMEQAKADGYWGYESDADDHRGEQYCVDCYGGQGSIPEIIIKYDPFSKLTAKCNQCGAVARGVVRAIL